MLKETLGSLAPRKIYICVAPCNARFMELFEGRDEFLRYMSELDDVPNVSVLNMFGDERFTDADFVDTMHLSMEGAKKFTLHVKDALRKSVAVPGQSAVAPHI